MILAFQWLRQKDHEFKAKLGYVVRLSQKVKHNTTTTKKQTHKKNGGSG